MPQLYGKIRINGKELFQYESVIVDSNDNDRKFGMKASLEMEQSIGDTELFVKRKKDRDTIEISLYKCDTLGRPLPITEDELFELNRIMFAKEGLSVVENHDFVYYGVFQSGTSWRNTAKQGYIKVEFEMATATPMSRVRYISRHILTKDEIDIINKCNAGEYSIADIEVENIKGSTFVIENVLTGEEFTITGLDVGEKFRIYGDTREIVSFTNPDKNLFKNCNKQFNILNLRYGLTKFKITSKECKVRVIYQSQICFQ